MNLSRPFIDRPIATTLLALVWQLLELWLLNYYPCRRCQQIDFPTISVQATFPGASPEIMATSVATPLEHQLGRISGITQMTSASNLGSTHISLQFDLTQGYRWRRS